jgi:hypothetical protein
VILFGALLASAPTVSAAPTPAVVVVVHGVRGLVADVYLDGRLTLSSFQPERSTDPLTLDAGHHIVEVRPAGTAASAAPLLHADVTLTAGAHEAAVVHLDANGQPVVTIFEDDVSPVAAGQARVVLRHAAAVGPVDAAIDARPVAAALLNGQQNTSIVAAGSHQLAATQSATPLLPAQTIAFAEGTVTYLYLIGSQGSGTLAWTAVKELGLQTPPTRVQTGDGSLTSRLDLSALALPVGLVLTGLVLGAGVTVAARRSRRTV